MAAATQRQFARDTRVGAATPQSVTRFRTPQQERPADAAAGGIANPSVAVLLAISDTVGISLAEFVSGVGAANSKKKISANPPGSAAQPPAKRRPIRNK